MAPNTIGLKDIDAMRAIDLLEQTYWIYDELLEGDVNKYMVDARTMRDLSLSIGAERLYDFFDDHVNMARDDVLEIAAKNYPSLEREWDFIYDCLIRFTNKIGVDTSVLYASTQQ